MKKFILLITYLFVSNVFSQVIQYPQPSEVIDPGTPQLPSQTLATQENILNGCDLDQKLETLLKKFDVYIVLQKDILLNPDEYNVETSRIVLHAKEESKNLRIFKKNRKFLVSGMMGYSVEGFGNKFYINDKVIHKISFPYDLLDYADIKELETSSKAIKFRCLKKTPVES